MRVEMLKRIVTAIVFMTVGSGAFAIDTDRPEVQQFIDRMVEEHSYDRERAGPGVR